MNSFEEYAAALAARFSQHELREGQKAEDAERKRAEALEQNRAYLYGLKMAGCDDAA